MNPRDLNQNNAKYISAMGSVAHTYGNLLATAQKWVLDIFPEKTFKTVHVSSKIAHAQILSTPHQFLKKSKPIIVFRPRIAYEDDSFLAKTLMVERMGGPLTSKTPGVIELHPFLFDPEAHIDMQYTETRRTMYLDVSMTFGTMIQQLNYMEFLRNELPLNRPFDIDMHLEAYLSKELMEMISTLSGVPIHDHSGSVVQFLDYMNDHAFFPVTYKLAGSTGREEFYRYYPTKVLATITDLDKNDGDSLGQVMTNYQISFTLKMDFWTPGTNYLFSPHIHNIPKPEPATDATFVPIFADIFAYEDLNLAPGWKVHTHSSCILDKPNDSVVFAPMIEHSIKEIINYSTKNGIPVVNFIDIKVRKQGDLLDPIGNYDVDYSNFTINFHNRDYGYYTYTIIISVDAGYINQAVKEIFNLK